MKHCGLTLVFLHFCLESAPTRIEKTRLILPMQESRILDRQEEERAWEGKGAEQHCAPCCPMHLSGEGAGGCCCPGRSGEGLAGHWGY